MREILFDMQRFAVINNSKANTLVSGTNGNDSIHNKGYDSVTVDAGAGDDSIYNDGGYYFSVKGGTGDDYIYSSDHGYMELISGGTGNDTIYSDAWINSINGGAGNDSIVEKGSDATILGGDGNDTINNFDVRNTINGGAGNDLIYNEQSHYASIRGGKGNDTISISGTGNLIQYTTGDGNDVIYGFNSTSTFQILGNGYSSMTSGSDIIVTVGKGKISLVGAANLSTVNLDYYEVVNENNSVKVNGTNKSDRIYNNFGEHSTINGKAGNDFIYNTNSPKTSINGSAGNDYIVNESDSVTVAGGDGNDSIFNTGSNFSINGGAGDDYIESYNYTIGNSTILGGAGNDTISSNDVYNHLIVGGVGDDVISLGGNTQSILISYNAGDGNDKIYNFSGADTLSIGGGSYSTSKSGKNIIVTIGDGKITLDGAATLDAVNIKGAKAATNTWRLNGTTATYGTTSKTLVTVKGVKSTSGLSVNGKVVTVAASALNKSKVSITGSGYTLKLADDVTKSASTSKAWSYSSINSKATYKQTKSAYYSLVSNSKSISYKAATNSTLATVSGVKSKSGLSVSGKVVTVAASALNKSNVSITGNGYTLKLADDVTKSTTKKAAWSLNKSTATYKSSYKTAGYSLASNAKSISYTKTATTPSTLAKISGVSKKNFTVSNKTITVQKSMINSAKKVSVNGSGYEFNFAKGDYNKTSITGSSSADKITTRGSEISISGGSKNDTIKSLGTLTTIKGGAGNDLISLGSNASKNIIQYSSGDGNDIIRGFKANSTLRIGGGNGTYSTTTSGSNVIVTVGTGKITLAGAKNLSKRNIVGKTQSTGTSGSSTDTGITLESSYADTTFNLNDIEGGSNIVTIDASAVNHKLEIKGNAKANRITGTAKNDYLIGEAGDDKLYGGNGNDTFRGGAGDDSIWGDDGNDVFIYYDGNGNDVINDYEEGETIKISGSSGNTISVTPSIDEADVVLKVGKGSIRIKDANERGIGVSYIENGIEYGYKNGQETFTISKNNEAVTLTGSYWKDSFDLTSFANKKIGNEIRIIDASSVTGGIEITGNAKANEIRCGAGRTTFIGGAGDDVIYSGKNSNVYVYNNGDGNDKIYNYGDGDKVNITSGTVSGITVGENNTVIFTVGKGKISLENAATKDIHYVVGGQDTIYPASASNILEDDNYAVAPLSALVQNNSADYSLAEENLSLSENKLLPILSSSKK